MATLSIIITVDSDDNSVMIASEFSPENTLALLLESVEEVVNSTGLGAVIKGQVPTTVLARLRDMN
jgi:hypothetical protein